MITVATVDTNRHILDRGAKRCVTKRRGGHGSRSECSKTSNSAYKI